MSIIEFPRSKVIRQIPVDLDVIEQAKEKGLRNFCDAMIDDMITHLISDLENCGIDTETESFKKDFSFTAEGLRATVYRSFGVDHNLHDFIDENVKMTRRDTGEVIDTDDDMN